MRTSVCPKGELGKTIYFDVDLNSLEIFPLKRMDAICPQTSRGENLCLPPAPPLIMEIFIEVSFFCRIDWGKDNVRGKQ